MPRGRRPPPSPVSLEGFSRFFSVTECVAFIVRALTRAGLREEDLSRHQLSLFRELDDPLDEEALAELHAYWTYDVERLLDRGRHPFPGLPAKPQIDIALEVTSKGNLKAEWFPRDWDRLSDQTLSPRSDFRYWRWSPNRSVAYDSRPSNELFILRSFEPNLRALRETSGGVATEPLTHVLLTACARVVTDLKDRLSYHFEARMLRDVFAEWRSEDADNGVPWAFSFAPDRVASWELADPVERQREAELLELAEMKTTRGFSEAELIAARDAEAKRVRPSGPAPAPHTLSSRISRELKRQGLPATVTGVERGLLLIERHRRQGNVVPLR